MADAIDLSDGCLDEEEETSDEETEPQGDTSAASAAAAPQQQQRQQEKQKQQHKGRGKGPPQGSSNVLLDLETTWGDLHLSRQLLKALDKLGYAHPSHVQAAAIPPALQGRDLLVNAQTGSGKTAAFLLPLLERLLQSPGVKTRKMSPGGPIGGLRGTKGLVLLPTRELAMQCHTLLQALTKYAPLTSTLAVGGVSLSQQEAALRRQPDVVVATPGRILDLLLNSAAVHLELLEVVILDEADRLLELGFRDEILQVLKHCHRGRQTLLFSATLTAAISSLALLALNSPLHITCRASGSSSSSSSSSSSTKQQQRQQERLPENLQQQFVELPGEGLRMAALIHLVRTAFNKRVIVFFGRKKAAHEAFLIFSLLGIPAAELHGDLTQQMRVEALEKFDGGEVEFLLASELASRGLDVEDVSAVINFNPPQDADRYVHCVGRTARMGREGTAVTLYDRNSAERLAVKKLLAAVGSRGQQQQQQQQQVLRRRIDAGKLEAIGEELRALEGQFQKKRQEEKLEREMRLAMVYVKKAENMKQHADEIYSRPQREWFVSERDKRSLQEASRLDAEAKALITNSSSNSSSSSSSSSSKDAAAATNRKKQQQQQQETTESGSSEASSESDKEEDAEESDEELPAWATAETGEYDEEEGDFGDAEETPAASSQKGFVKVREIKIGKEQKAKLQQLQQQQQQQQRKKKGQQVLTQKQKERMEEFRIAKAAGRKVKRGLRPQRMRMDIDTPDDEWPGRGPSKKQQRRAKRKRDTFSEGSSSTPKEETSLHKPKKQRRGASISKSSFKSKKRYKRR